MAVLDPHLRKNIVFADHSLATDSVFSEMHFVSCRNTMIYFNPTLQNRAIGLFHDSLDPARLPGHRLQGESAVLRLRKPVRGRFAARTHLPENFMIPLPPAPAHCLRRVRRRG